ncbi:hypothetical protein GCM10017668_00710 [Streptomyces tuirus]|uniref:Histidine kinase/HSP90-like ATPase domain-containing protein n=1 Tax=Streptomyces tuirus TaxID=68278 RepID=A0A7G1N595_9ACTN|nr:hypothetical protein GCM10017668_00710 [Streptomyces tuirus]
MPASSPSIGLPVPARAMDLTQLVVSELFTHALKYAAGPVLMELRIAGGQTGARTARAARPHPLYRRPSGRGCCPSRALRA